MRDLDPGRENTHGAPDILQRLPQPSRHRTGPRRAQRRQRRPGIVPVAPTRTSRVRRTSVAAIPR
ncbi:hypothetical protein ACFYXM_34405 [Streptomyces sp. NPDC002476]|uniref:hypothetical protein n=1 Tax=Streptomyces sp. NPDC002476 TaxID=3364648 RepID=UPI0036C4C67C